MRKARVTTVFALLLAAALRTAGRQAETRPLYRLSLPDKNWALDLDLTAFNIPEGSTPADAGKGSESRPAIAPVESLSDDGREYQLVAFRRAVGNTPLSKVALQLRMVPTRDGAGAEDFRAARLKELAGREGLKVSGVKTWEYGQIPVARFASGISFDVYGGPSGPLATTAGPKLRSIEAYFVREGVGITLGILAPDLGEREEKFFYSLLDSVKFADTSAPSTGFDYYHKGRPLFLRKDYRRAAEALAAALDMERRERRLDTATWRELVLTLADAYAGAGEYARSKEVLDYAAASDPSNPLFQMSLARFAAAAGDLEQTIGYLEKAFRLHAASGPLPDPLRDRSFQRFWKEERFRKAVKAMSK